MNKIVKEVKPDVKVIGRTWYLKKNTIDYIVQNTPEGIGVRMKEPSGNKYNTISHHGKEEDDKSDILLLKKTIDPDYGKIYLNGAKIRGDDFYASTGIGDVGESTDPVIGMQTPYIAATKIRRLADNNIKNIAVWWGGLHAWTYSANHEVLKEMIWNPFIDSDKLIMEIASRDFGDSLSNDVIKLWKTIDLAFETWDYVNWTQQFEEFVGRYGYLYIKPLAPDTIIQTRWYQHIWKDTQKIVPSQREAMKILTNAEKLAKKIYDKANSKDVRRRAKQQYSWLKLYNNIFQTQLNTLEVINLINNLYNPEKDYQTPDFTALTSNPEYKQIIKDEIENCTKTIETIQFINLPNFRFFNSDKLQGQEKSIEMLKNKINAMEIILKL